MAFEYNIDQRVQEVKAGRQYPAKKVTDWTEEKKAEALVGYKELSEEEWSKLPVRAHVRYLRKDGSWKPGGYVRNHFTKDGQSGMYLENKFDSKAAGYASWPIMQLDIKKIWVRAPIVEEDEITKIKQYCKALEARLSATEARFEKLKLFVENRI